MKLALVSAACCALGISAISRGKEDLGFTEGGLSEEATDAELEMDSETWASQHAGALANVEMMQHVKVSVAKEAQRWVSLLLLANGTQMPVEPGGAGCSDADRRVAKTRGEALASQMQKAMQAMLPNLVQGKSVNVHDLVTLPEICSSKPDPEEAMDAIYHCIQDSLGTSDECTDCLPHVLVQMRDSCAEVCTENLKDFTSGVEAKVGPSAMQVAKSGKAPAQEDMMKIAQTAMTSLSDGSVKKLAPCSECVLPHGVWWAECTGGSGAGKSAQEGGRNFIEKLKSGNVMDAIMKMA